MHVFLRGCVLVTKGSKLKDFASRAVKTCILVRTSRYANPLLQNLVFLSATFARIRSNRNTRSDEGLFSSRLFQHAEGIARRNVRSYLALSFEPYERRGTKQKGVERIRGFQEGKRPWKRNESVLDRFRLERRPSVRIPSLSVLPRSETKPCREENERFRHRCREGESRWEREDPPPPCRRKERVADRSVSLSFPPFLFFFSTWRKDR